MGIAAPLIAAVVWGLLVAVFTLSLLVHGVADVALAVVVISLRAPLDRSGRHRGITRAATVTGLVSASRWPPRWDSGPCPSC